MPNQAAIAENETKAEDHTRSFFGRFMRSANGAAAVAQTFVANILIQTINILCGVICARSLGPVGRGELAASIMWPQLLAYALTLGIPVSSVYHIRKSPADASSLAGTALFSSIAMGLVAAVLGWIVIPFSLHTYPAEVIHFARLAMLLAPLSLLALTLSVQAQSAGSFHHFNFFRLAQPTLILLVLLATWSLHVLEPKTAALAYLLAGLPVTAWNLIWVCKRFCIRWAFDLCQLKLLLGYGLRAWGADLIGTAASQVDRFLVIGLLAPEFMGLYVVAQSAANLLNVLPSAMVPVLMPKAVDRPLSEIVKLTGKATRVTLLVLIGAGLPFMMVGGTLLHAFYGQRFDGAAGVFHLLVLESIVDGVTYVLSQAFLAAGSPGVLALLEATSLIAAVPCLWMLVPRFGLIGAGLSVLTVTSIRLGFVLSSFRFSLKVNPPSLIIRADDLAVFASLKSRFANS